LQLKFLRELSDGVSKKKRRIKNNKTKKAIKRIKKTRKREKIKYNKPIPS